jgi:hypothetical protein
MRARFDNLCFSNDNIGLRGVSGILFFGARQTCGPVSKRKKNETN